MSAGSELPESPPKIETDEPVATLTMHGQASATEHHRLLLALQGEAKGARYRLDVEYEGDDWASYLLTPVDQPTGGES